MATPYYLAEATERSSVISSTVADIKRCMNTCRLSKFRSDGECLKLYTAFFDTSLSIDLTYNEWATIYRTLMYDDKFTDNMSKFLVLWKIPNTTTMFKALYNIATLNVPENIAFKQLADFKILIRSMMDWFETMSTMIQATIPDVQILQIFITIRGALTDILFSVNNLLKAAVSNNEESADMTLAYKPAHTIDPMDEVTLSEDVKAFIEMLTGYDVLIEQYANNLPDILDPRSIINEGIVSKAKEAATVAAVKIARADKTLNDVILKKFQEIRDNRRDRKRKEIIGEALRINHEIGKILLSLGIGAINPAIGVTVWVARTIIDYSNDKKDRDVLVGQIKNEIEIVDEKISQAERNGKDKDKIKLMRVRHKLVTTYERVNRIKYDSARQNR